MSSVYFTFDYDKQNSSWNYARDCIPEQLVSMNISMETWEKFWDTAQDVQERSKIRQELFLQKIVEYKQKHQTKDISMHYLPKELKDLYEKLETETQTEWKSLATIAEEDFLHVKVQESICKIQHLTPTPSSPSGNATTTKRKTTKDLFENSYFGFFGLEIELFQQNYETYRGNKIQFYYDTKRCQWNLPRAPIPKELMMYHRMSSENWFKLWDHAQGVYERATLRKKANEQHDLEIRVLKNIASGKAYEPLTDEVNKESPQIRVNKLVSVKNQNIENTKIGWNQLIVKAKEWIMMNHDNEVKTGQHDNNHNEFPIVTPVLDEDANDIEGCYGISIQYK